MPTSTKVNDLKINRLTKAQYDTAVEAGIIGENELSIITDLEGGQVIQVDELPEATSENEGKIYQYVGETIPDVEANAIIEQTVGSGLTDLEVDIKKYEEVEQPEDGDIVDFVASVTESSLTYEAALTNHGEIIFSGNYTDLRRLMADYDKSWDQWTKHAVIWLNNNNDHHWSFGPVSGADWLELDDYTLGLYNIYITKDENVTVGDYITYDATDQIIIWTKDSTEVNPVDYGISYTGTLEDGDILEVEYSAFKSGITNGYFYQNQPEYSDPIATIEQTVGRADSIAFEIITGNTEISGTCDAIRNLILDCGYDRVDFANGTIEFTYSDNSYWPCIIRSTSTSASFTVTPTQSQLEAWGFVFTGIPQLNDNINCTFVLGNIYNLLINKDEFIKTEQPSGDETVEFTFSSNTMEIIPNVYDQDIYIEIANPNLFVNKALELWHSRDHYDLIEAVDISITCIDGNIDYFQVDMHGSGVLEQCVIYDPVSDWGIIFDGRGSTSQGWRITNAKIIYGNWLKNEEAVNLSDYGISYTGIPEDNNELTVTYTHPSIIGYQWNQKDVQPSSGKTSGEESIDWATIIDVHEGENRGWETFPIYTIEGGLPDGEYEFYWQTKCSTESYDNRPLGMATYKAIVNINNDNRSCRGVGGYIIDGKWMGDGNFKTDNNNIWGLFKKSGNDIIIYASGSPFATDVFGYNPSYGELLECFKLSSIKNTKTGEKYIATGKLFDGNWPSVDYSYENYILISSLQSEPYVPRYHSNNDWYNPKDNQYYRIQPYNSISTSQHTANCSELDISMVSKSGGKWHIIVENSYDSYKATLLEASGDLANAQLGYNQDGYTFIYLNNTDISNQYISVSIGAKGSNEATSGWTEVPNSFTPITINKIGNPVTKDNFGTILQYTDETTSEYKKGYFYQATGTEVIVPEAIVCTQRYGEESIEITCNDYDGLISALYNYTGWTESYIRERLQVGDWFSCRPNNQPYVWYWSTYGEFPDSIGIGDYFTLNPYPNSETQFTVIDVPEHTEIQDGYWEQVNVQPNTTVTTIPEATVENYGNVVQYIGQTDQNYTNGYFYKNNAIVTPSSATISQTSGSNLSNITINRLQFEDTEQPIGDENTTFVYAKTTNDIQFTSFGSASMTGGSLEDLKAIFTDDGVSWVSDFEHGTYFYRPDDSAYGFGPLNKAGIWAYCTPEHLQECGFILTGDITNGDYIEYQVITDNPGEWKHNSNTVNLKDYGISYEGIPENNNELTVIYTAKVVVGGWDRIDVQPAADPLPDQTGNAGKVLMTDGTTTSWVDIASTPASTPTLQGTSTYWIEDPNTHIISQTINVQGVTATNVVMVSPTPVSADNYAQSGVICTAQGIGTLTFTCKTIPSVDLTLNVVCF